MTQKAYSISRGKSDRSVILVHFIFKKHIWDWINQVLFNWFSERITYGSFFRELAEIHYFFSPPIHGFPQIVHLLCCGNLQFFSLFLKIPRIIFSLFKNFIYCWKNSLYRSSNTAFFSIISMMSRSAAGAVKMPFIY